MNRKKARKIDKINYNEIIRIIILVLCSYAFAYYMQFEYILWKTSIVCVVLYYAYKKSSGYHLDKIQLIVACLFPILISFSLVLGYHIHVESSYSGLIDTSYIADYHFSDWIALFLMIYGFFIVFRFLLSLNQGKNHNILNVDPYRKKDNKRIVLYTMICFFCWLPYLITYFPGFIFGDSLASIQQALGNSPLDNAHPVLYTLLIRFCFWLGQLWKNKLTAGCAIYCIIQMMYMAYGMGYLFHWLEVIYRLKKIVAYILIACFGLSPYIAQYGIAMWKDPIFSTTILLLTIQIADILYSATGSKQKTSKNDKTIRIAYIRLFLLLLLLVFSRNNGLYIVAALVCFAAAFSILAKKQQTYRILLGIFLLTILLSKIITGPVYHQLGVSQSDEKVESYGIFLQQMARVVAVNGKLSEKDSEYMGSLLALDQYAVVYTPCCVDSLKWNENFHKEPLENNFFQTYFSILRKNPKICFEAWMMQTYGYWSLNCSAINQSNSNIHMGVPRNIYTEYTDATDLGIHFKPIDTNAWNAKVFPNQSRCIPIAYINWLLLILLSLSLLKKDWNTILILGASLGLMATLLIASPINYWPRYGLAEQLLIPFYLVLLLRLLGNSKIVKWIH